MRNLWRFSKKSALVLFFVLGAVHVHSTSSNASAQASGFAASMPDVVLQEGTQRMRYNESGTREPLKNSPKFGKIAKT
jgi:hypothetical protein